jgi:hypothetical protein
MSSTLTNSNCMNSCSGDFRNEFFSNVLPWVLNLLVSLPTSVNIDGEVRKINHYKVETVHSDFNARIRTKDIEKLRKRSADLGINLDTKLPTAFDAFNTLNATEKVYFTGYIHDLKSFVNRWIPGIFGHDVINYTGVKEQNTLKNDQTVLQKDFEGDNTQFSSIQDDINNSEDNNLTSNDKTILISPTEIEVNKRNKNRIEQAIDYVGNILHDAELNILYHAKARMNIVPDTVNIGKDRVDLEKLEALHVLLKIYAMSEALQRSTRAKLVICLTLANGKHKDEWLPSREVLISPSEFMFTDASMGGIVTNKNFFQNLQWKLKTNTGLMGHDKLVLEFGR